MNNDDYDENFSRAGLPEPLERRAHVRALYFDFSLRYSIWIVGPLMFTWLYPHWWLNLMFAFGFKCCETCGTWMFRVPSDFNPVFDCPLCIYGEPYMVSRSVWSYINWQAIGGWLFILGWTLLVALSALGYRD